MADLGSSCRVSLSGLDLDRLPPQYFNKNSTSVYVYTVEYSIDYSTHDSYCEEGTTLQSLLVKLHYPFILKQKCLISQHNVA